MIQGDILSDFRGKMFRYVFFILAVFFLSVLVIIFLVQKEKAIQKFNDDVEWISRAIEMSIREPMWNLDQKGLMDNFNSFLTIESVKRLYLREYFAFLEVETGELPPEDKVFAVEKEVKHNGEILGTLEIDFTYEVLEKEIISNLVFVITQVFFMFIALIFILNGVSKMYMRPIKNLEKVIKNFDLENPTSDISNLNPDNVVEINKVIESFSKMSEEIFAGYEQLEAYNKSLEEVNNELENKNRENEVLTEKLSMIIDLAEKFKDSTQLDEREFMKSLFDNSFRIIEEADYGSAYFCNKKYVDFVDTMGHDLEKLKMAKIPSEYFIINTRETLVRKKILNETKFLLKDEVALKTVMEASKHIKETLFFELYIDETPFGGICLDIDAASEKCFSKESVKAMDSFRNLAIAFYQIQRYTRLKDDFTKDLIVSITQMLEIHDKYTKGHSENVANLTVRIAKEMKLDDKTIHRAYWSGLVHDIGKILVPDNILNKNGRLTEEEYNVIKQHPVWGYQTLMNSGKLNDMAIFVLHHHERWDGNGYPNGLEKTRIPLISRIISVADSWDAMMSNRSYKKPLGYEEALTEIKENSGTQFDPEIVLVFLKIAETGELKGYSLDSL
jgi:HD-GYP domain-containing protein (c-di-GMP phosphodiesterase class II)/regulator of replication initiation timing